MKTVLTRREVLAVGAAAALPRPAVSAPAATVAIARCRTYSDSLESKMARIFDQIGGIGSLVKGKTVAVKLNLTGNPARFPERADLPYRNNPDTVLAAYVSESGELAVHPVGGESRTYSMISDD